MGWDEMKKTVLPMFRWFMRGKAGSKKFEIKQKQFTHYSIWNGSKTGDWIAVLNSSSQKGSWGLHSCIICCKGMGMVPSTCYSIFETKVQLNNIFLKLRYFFINKLVGLWHLYNLWYLSSNSIIFVIFFFQILSL